MSHALRSLSGFGTRRWAATASRTHSIPIFNPAASSSRGTLQHGRLFECRRSFWSKLFGRKKSAAPNAPVDPDAPKFIYPESLCLFSAGRRMVWVGCMKLMSCYPFLMTVFYLGPNIDHAWPALLQYPLAAAHPTATAALMLAITAAPMGMFYLAAPYITHLYVKIPPYARVSKAAAMGWARKALTPETKLRIFTMRLLGRPKLVEVPIGELRFCKKRLGCVNLEWQWTAKEKPRVTDFYIERKVGAGKVQHEVFYEVMDRIAENATKGGAAVAANGGEVKGPVSAALQEGRKKAQKRRA
ncbi:hypothetical protein Dda_3125 [Drechslerella dactyloides]|uniref:Uncharacterized protein n=1 Tax=Drechslerella dactyloides TaxID=74499 RepID=A0AAD6J0S3_DREDA|nr:hypothetical protein Dda_3125 [Drechslerella dactyloides]